MASSSCYHVALWSTVTNREPNYKPGGKLVEVFPLFWNMECIKNPESWPSLRLSSASKQAYATTSSLVVLKLYQADRVKQTHPNRF